MLKTLNLAIRFLLELCGLGLLAYWGVQVGANAFLKESSSGSACH
ncbi:MAG: DUF2568 domain-containing protein [Gemmatimonadales bacterium]|nr:DUF2568 domain-containing protein [Gemmatimonadales bacterium]